MTLWVVRAGKYGEREQLALDQRSVVIGWEALPDLKSVANDRRSLATLLEKTYTDCKPKTLLNWESQIWPFICDDVRQDCMKVGDIACIPLKSRPFIAVGKIEAGYKFRADLPDDAGHTRPVNWLGEIARASLDPSLRFSFGGAMTVFRITRGDAEHTVQRLLKSGSKPQDPTESSASATSSATDARAAIDIAETARDAIRAFIDRRFKGHGLTRLVAAVLQTQGYTVSIAPEGSDRGVDIIAGRGPLGLEPPRLVVQVKSGNTPTDAATVQQLQGAMAMTKASHGLFVSWGGYRGSLNWSTTLTQHFDLRLWSDNDLIDAIEESYDALPAEIQAELPLRRVWSLVPADDEG